MSFSYPPYLKKSSERRLDHYSLTSQKLALLSNENLLALLQQGRPLHKGMGGISFGLEIEESKLFVKKIPLTALERFRCKFEIR